VVVPWARLAVTLVVAVVAGVIAAAWPAHRASQVPVLELISRDR
jgi:putative ABC transport system permease protein